MLLTSARVVLRELALGDLDFVAEMLGDPVVMRYYPKCLTRAEAQAWIERQQERYRRDGHGLWLASLQATGQPIGQIGLLRQRLPDGPEWEVGYLLDRRCWHQGYATGASEWSRRRGSTLLASNTVCSPWCEPPPIMRPNHRLQLTGASAAQLRRAAALRGRAAERRILNHGG